MSSAKRTTTLTSVDSKSPARLGLGLDAGGTKTRWALSGGDGQLFAEGFVAGLTALQLGTTDGRAHIHAAMADLANQVLAFGIPTGVCAGVTGLDTRDEQLCCLIAAPLGIDSDVVTVHSDIEIVYRDLFAPGEGYVVYAGTGSIAAFIDTNGELHRAGGRGVYLDDAGGGFWMAREALRHIWRREDEAPGSWRQSPLAVAVFAQMGGSDWAVSRQFFYSRERGEIGQLAMAVAATVESDAESKRIVSAAGDELARLANAMLHRLGVRPIILVGGAAQLHPLIEARMRAGLGAEISLTSQVAEAHIAASRIAARF